MPLNMNKKTEAPKKTFKAHKWETDNIHMGNQWYAYGEKYMALC